MSNDQIINKIVSYLQTKPVIRGYLFGSFARNEATQQSDIDLLLEIDYNQRVSLLDFIGWSQDLQSITSKKIDLVSEDGLSPRIKPYIEKDRKIIYERK